MMFDETEKMSAEEQCAPADEKSALKKEKTDKAMKKVIAALTGLGKIGEKFDFSDAEQERIFESIQKSVERAKVKFARDDEFSL